MLAMHAALRGPRHASHSQDAKGSLVATQFLVAALYVAIHLLVQNWEAPTGSLAVFLGSQWEPRRNGVPGDHGLCIRYQVRKHP